MTSLTPEPLRLCQNLVLDASVCPHDECKADRSAEKDAAVYGMCTGCGSVEVALVRATGTRDLSGMGESAQYPTGYGCEVCS